MLKSALMLFVLFVIILLFSVLTYRTTTNFCFADDIDGLAGEEELAKLVERLDKVSTAYCMKTSAEKTKLMTSNT